MDEFVKAVRRFIVRDLLYVIGGSLVMFALLSGLHKMPGPTAQVHEYLFLCGMAYVAGYTVQDTTSMLGITSTRNISRPHRLARWCYERFSGERWAETRVDRSDLLFLVTRVHSRLRLDILMAERERYITLMQMGTTMGPCCVLASLILLSQRFTPAPGDFCDLLLIVPLVIMGVLLTSLGWVKACQLTCFEGRLLAFCEERITDLQAEAPRVRRGSSPSL